MNFKIAVKHSWNKLRLYLSLLLFIFYLIIGILFLFTDIWDDFLSRGKEIIGIILILFGVLRLYIAYRRYTQKHKHIKVQSFQKKKELIKERKNVKNESE